MSKGLLTRNKMNLCSVILFPLKVLLSIDLKVRIQKCMSKVC